MANNLSLAIFDLDGTLVNNEVEKLYHPDDYFVPEVVEHLPPNHEIMNQMIKCVNNGFDIAVITGRQNDLRQATYNWLVKNCSEFLTTPIDLIMRPHEVHHNLTAPWKLRMAINIINQWPYKPLRVLIYDDQVDNLQVMQQGLKDKVLNVECYLVEAGYPQVWKS